MLSNRCMNEVQATTIPGKLGEPGMQLLRRLHCKVEQTDRTCRIEWPAETRMDIGSDDYFLASGTQVTLTSRDGIVTAVASPT